MPTEPGTSSHSSRRLRRARRSSPAAVIMGAVLLVLGVILAGPLVWLQRSLQVTQGGVIAVLQIPVSEGLVRLEPVIEIDLGGGSSTLSMGLGDSFGRPVLGPTVAVELADEASARLMQRRSLPATVQAQQPFDSARVWIDGESALFRFRLGIACLLTPMLAWSVHRLLRASRER